MQQPKQFDVNGTPYTQAEMAAENADDEALCEWLDTAKVGETFPAFIPCERVA